MFRYDYEELLERCKDMEPPYALRTLRDNNFARGYSKMVDTGTTAIVLREGVFDKEDIPQGLFMVIYPFDKVPDRIIPQSIYSDVAKLRKDSVNNFIHSLGGYMSMDEWRTYADRYNGYLTQYNGSDSPYVANLALLTRSNMDVRHASDLECQEVFCSEGIEGYIPRNSHLLGPVLQRNKSISEKVNIADPSKPYTEYMFHPDMKTDDEFLQGLSFPIGKDFLKEETRNGYLVTAAMKRQWALCIDMLTELDRVCRENGIRWFADGGTLLGTIRHHGFIPWDDDIDVMLPREDYDRLLSLSDKFTGKYFLQTFDTDYVCKSKSRLINTESSVLCNYEDIGGRHQEKLGCFIDIFPLDKIKDIQWWSDLCRRRIGYLRMANHYKNVWQATGSEEAKALMKENYKVFDTITKEGSSLDEAEYGANLGFLQSARFLLRNMEDYEDVVYMPFEMLSLPCPKGYKRCLDYIYGEDWNVFKKNGACHNLWKYDTDTPYEKYVEYINSNNGQKADTE